MFGEDVETESNKPLLPVSDNKTEPLLLSLQPATNQTVTDDNKTENKLEVIAPHSSIEHNVDDNIRLTAFTALGSLCEQLHQQILNATDPQTTTLQQKGCFTLQMLIACFSGVLYWQSPDQATQRYGTTVKQSSSSGWLSFFFSWKFPNHFGAITNALFNAESYQTLWDFISQSLSEAESYLTGHRHEYIEWFIATIASVGVTLPFWHLAIAETGPVMTWLVTMAAIANLPVNADGAKSLIDWIKSFDVKDRVWEWYNFGGCFFSSRNIKQKKRYAALRQARNILVTALIEKAENLLTLNATEREPILQNLVNNENQTTGLQFFSVLLSINTGSDRSNSSDNKCCTYTLKALKAILGFLGIYQNFGPMVDSYKAGADIHVSLGYIATICNILPSLGFSIKGIMGEGIVEVFREIIGGKRSLESIESPRLYWGLMVVSMVAATFSGFSGDQLNYDAWKEDIELGGDTGAWISGIMGNLGTAIVFNLPQCVCFVTRCLDLYLTKMEQNDVKQIILLKQGMEKLANILQKMPMDKCEEFFDGDGNFHEVIFSILQGKMEDEDIAQLGQFYLEQINLTVNEEPANDNHTQLVMN